VATPTDYERVLNVFYSEIRNKYPLPADLIGQWFTMAVADYELDIAPLNYDGSTKMFAKASGAVINTLGLIMARYYIKREQSRINKLNNVLGKDIQLNSTAATKSAVQAEYENILQEIESKLYKLKQHSFN